MPFLNAMLFIAMAFPTLSKEYIKLYDTIRFTTPEGTSEYRVVSTKIVGPKDTSVLDNKSAFYCIGPAPKRFIVEATKD